MMFGNNPGAEVTATMIPKGSVGVELGVWMGNSSIKFVERTKHLHLVDAWSTVSYEESDEHGGYEKYLERYSKLTGGKTPKEFQDYYDKVYESVVQRFKGKDVTIHRMTTDEFFASFTEKVDWVYVDASHSYDGVLSDLRNSLNIVKKGGTIFGDDYSYKKYPVLQAVDKFAQETGKEIDVFYMDQYRIEV